ncbi:hypothetical protein ACNOYE_20760 [Nannocystaceae bacterium ST9]
MTLHLERPIVEPGLHTHDQAELAEAMRRRIADLPGVEPIRQMVGFVYEHAAIERRHLEIGLAELATRTDWYRLVNQATTSLARRALARLIRPDLPAAEFDALIVVSSTFAGFPALSRLLQVELGLRLDALCYDLAGLGCAGPTHGLHLASLLIESGACRRVALVCADVMGTHGESRVHHEVPSMSQLVAHCLASDGAAALVVSREPTSAACLRWTSTRLDTRLWPESLTENDFTASADNQPFIAVGKAIRTRLLDELGPLLAELEPETALFHPGGASLMRSLASVDPRLIPTLEISSAVLREHGNVGSASVLWVLHDAWRAGRPLGPNLQLIALGPGIVSTRLRLSGASV